MNKSVLIVTPFFAPQTHAAVFRAYKLAKYLPRFGWKPYVVTVDTNYNYNEDLSLLDDLPPEVEITKARYIEPTIRGLRMAVGGQNRTFPVLKTAAQSNPIDHPSATGANSAARSAYRYVLESWVQIPDAHRTWYRSALRSARELIRAHDIPIVYTTCLPYTCNQIGLQLQKEGLRWVADFRDPPPTYLARMSSRVDRIYIKQRRIERETVRHADGITVTSSACALILGDMYRNDIRCPVKIIPTGLDEDYLSCEADEGLDIAEEPYPYIVFTGEYLSEYGTQFLQTFSEALTTEALRQTRVRLLVVGRIEANQSRMVPAIQALGIQSAVVFRDHMPQRSLYRVLKGARAAVLNPGTTTHWWTTFAKMVDYVALGIPTLAIVPDPSEARSVLTKTGLGIFLDGDTKTAAQTLANFLSGSIPPRTPNEEECERYLASSQVKAFVDLFQGLL